MEMQEIKRSPGHPSPFGANTTATGINFSIVTKEIHKISLCLFEEERGEHPFLEIPFDPILNKTGDVWHMHIANLPPNLIYAYRVWTPGRESPYLLLDPYAKMIVSHPTWGHLTHMHYHPHGKIAEPSTFDWQGVQQPRIPLKEIILYEIHIRGFTRDLSSRTKFPGTYLGVIEKIPYLKDMGVNALEILPVHEFNEEEVRRFNLKSSHKLCNYFGYSTVNFFAPMTRYAYDAKEEGSIIEFKTMVRELHKNGIEVILDVVYNHTFEGNHLGPTLSFRGFDQKAYYMLDEQGNDLNYSGCGNTLNTNHPVTRELILDSLRYWVTEMHVDGFRFDLASILKRSQTGIPLNTGTIVDAISLDPILSQTKLIAEAWDAAGLYQVGGFYPGTRWSEWNGHYRDVVRRFIKGSPKQKTQFATALCGSQDLYGWGGRSPLCSINFVTAHDGFSLIDLVSYNEKHNLNNGENNRDGNDHNESWNCGIEGPTSNARINALRERQMRNFILALMVSQGIPMITMSDEYAHSRLGNNNTWCQDNALNWFLWDQLEKHAGFHRFVKAMIHFRKSHMLLNKGDFLSEKDITWHGVNAFRPDWENDNHFIAFTLNSNDVPALYIAFNAAEVGQMLCIPPAAPGSQWKWVVNTYNQPPEDFFEAGHRPVLKNSVYQISCFSAIMLACNDT